MTNPYGITLDSEWIEWATKEKASETVAAAVLLICETRPVHEVVAKLTPGEFERVVDIVRRSPDHFPPGPWPRSRAAVRYRQPGRNRIASRPIRHPDRDPSAPSRTATESAATSAPIGTRGDQSSMPKKAGQSPGHPLGRSLKRFVAGSSLTTL